MLTARSVRSFVVFGALLSALVPVIGGTAVAQKPNLKVGSARLDITPAEPVMLAGYEARKVPSRGVHDPLSARAVVFESDGRRLVLVTVDLVGFYGGSLDAVRGAILEGCGLEPSQLFLAAVHTHSGPIVTVDEAKGFPANVSYTKALGPKLAALVKEAASHEAPARLGYAAGSSPVGVNRRERVTDPKGGTRINLGRNPAGPTDPEVQVLVARPEGAGTPSLVLFGYSTHSTALGPGNMEISGDVHGLAAAFVERHLGHGLTAAPLAGASGDIDPWFRVLPGFKTDEGWTPEPVLLGTMLGEEVVRTAERVKPSAVMGPVRTASARLSLPGKPGGDEEKHADRANQPLNVTVGRVGDVAFVGLGCEAFNAVGRAIKARSPFPHTVVFTHCNGAAGYLPTRDAYPEGGYEVNSSAFGPDAADQVVAEVVKLLGTL